MTRKVVLTYQELRKMMIASGLASDKLTIKAYFERLQVFGFLKKLGLSGKFIVADPDIERVARLEEYDEERQLKKVVKTD